MQSTSNAGQWIGLRDFRVVRRQPIALAVIGSTLYFAALVAGSAAQSALGVDWRWGWGQQLVSALVMLAFAAALGSPAKLLGLSLPHERWLLRSVLVGLGIAIVGTVAGTLIADQTPKPTPEYFAYQATLPGIGEELAFRGMLLGLLATAALQRGWPWAGGWPLLLVAATPFALLHLLEHRGLDLAVLFGFTFFAGVALGWLRMTTASLLPAVVAHNLANVTSGLIELLVPG